MATATRPQENGPKNEEPKAPRPLFFTLTLLGGKSKFGAGKRGHYERGLFTRGISRISEISKFSRVSRVSRKWSDSPFFSRVWGFSKIFRVSKFSRISRISRKWTFLKRPLFQKTPFSEPDKWGLSNGGSRPLCNLGGIFRLFRGISGLEDLKPCDWSGVSRALRLLRFSSRHFDSPDVRPVKTKSCAQSSTIVHFYGLFGPVSKGNFRHKMTTIVGNRGQLWTSTLSLHLLSPQLFRLFSFVFASFCSFSLVFALFRCSFP